MDTDLISLGYASQVFQLSPAMLEIGLRAFGGKPVLTLNGVNYYAFAAMVQAKHFVEGQADAK